jgi:hypothetical protein
MNPSPSSTAVPGFDFLHKLAQGGAASWAQWVAPTLDAQALDKRIEELKAVQFWLDQNAAALKATIQALEVQKMTLATLRSMNVPLVWPAATSAAGTTPVSAEAPPAPRHPARRRAAQAAQSGQMEPKTGQTGSRGKAAAALPDPLQLWGALAQQFQQIATQALQDAGARHAAPVSAAKAARARQPRKAP